MHARLEELMAAAEAARAELLQLVEEVGPARWLHRIRSDGWRIGDVVGHLHLVEDSSVRLLFRALRDSRATGMRTESETSSLIRALDDRGIVEATEPRTAPPFTVEPDASDRDRILSGLAKSRDGLRLWAVEADGWALGDVVRPHPALGPLTLYEWVLFLGLHERRHIRQIRTILAGTPS